MPAIPKGTVINISDSSNGDIDYIGASPNQLSGVKVLSQGTVRKPGISLYPGFRLTFAEPGV